jgi:hypothetical protein
MFKQKLYICALGLLLASSSLQAANYATLKNGKTIILNDNGTWEEVILAPAQATQAAPFVAPKAEQPAQPSFVNDPLVQKLIGTWSGEGRVYEFNSDGNIVMKGTENEGKFPYVINSIDPIGQTISLSINESSRLGKVSFGGFRLIIKIMADGRTMTDITDPMSVTAPRLSKK